MQAEVGGQHPVRHVVAASQEMNAGPDPGPARLERERVASPLPDDDEVRLGVSIRRQRGQG